ncbi:MAG TPA: 4Fe-4S dicluster domain-containing protein [Chloroflexota bacterium]
MVEGSSPAAQPPIQNHHAVLDREGLNGLLLALQDLGYQVVGPTVRDRAIVYDRVRTIDDLPVGWTDEQDGGTYRLRKRDDDALFGYAVGPHSWKKYLFPPTLRLWKARREGDDLKLVEEEAASPPLAFLGVRSCELHAIRIQDKVFMGGSYVDPTYSARRETAFLIAVNCGHPGGTCFCVSMNTGPKADAGFDLALTEVLDSDAHYFLVEVGSERGAEVLSRIPQRPAGGDEMAAAAGVVESAAQQMGRQMETDDIKQLLYRNYEHPRWDDVASRCLSCTNCTMVCPTCFCSTVEDSTDLTGQEAERVRLWDSCFTVDFSYIHGGSVRSSPKSRYRQWMTHKLATWYDQFGTSGCVGCGRCITWCPVAIDITEEVAAIRITDGQAEIGSKGGDHGNA